MNICHYSLGLSPYRIGGMPKFAGDIMKKQIEEGHLAVLLYPGHYSWFFSKSKIKKTRVLYKNIEAYEIVNPKPISLCNGIKCLDDYVRDYDVEMWVSFFRAHHFDVVHVHTLQGLDLSFFEACRRAGVKTFYTTHDVFGLCPRAVPLFASQCGFTPSRLCEVCCGQAFSRKTVRLMQSGFYLKSKRSWIVKRIIQRRKKQRKASVVKSKLDFPAFESLLQQSSPLYEALQGYYGRILESFDVVHFNSRLSSDVFLRHFALRRHFVKTIFHEGISDHRGQREKLIDTQRIEFVILGPSTGMYVFLEVLQALWGSGKRNFHLTIYSDNYCPEYPFLTKHGPYRLVDQKTIFEQSDLLLFHEDNFATLSFIVLEALSFGVPCLVSGNVGAKSFVEDNNLGFAVSGGESALYPYLNRLLGHPELITKKTESLLNAPIDFGCSSFVDVYKEALDL